MSSQNRAHSSVKHDIVSKTNFRLVMIVSGTVFLVVFCIFVSRALFSQGAYHNRIISEKEASLRQLRNNVEPIRQLTESFESFESAQINIISGNPLGEGPNDGLNSKIVEDSLPSKYDFPALTSSFEKILQAAGVETKAIGGREDESLTSTTVSAGTATADEVPYTFSFSGSQNQTKVLLELLERSIRPMHVTNLNISIGGETLDTRVTLNTYFTQKSSFILDTKEID